MFADIAVIDAPRGAVIVPVYNEAAVVRECCTHLAGLRSVHQVLFVDGQSDDGTPEILERLAAEYKKLERPCAMRVVAGTRGRAAQMNKGAALSNADVLVFLHADTRLPPHAMDEILRACCSDRSWGRFDVRFDSSSLALRTIAWFMNRRSSVTGIATGDQAIFVSKRLFDRVGGFPEIPLMEDVALSKRLRRVSPPYRIRLPVTTAARRWQRNGVVGTVLRMWCNRLLFWAGVAPERLAARYRDVR